MKILDSLKNSTKPTEFKSRKKYIKIYREKTINNFQKKINLLGIENTYDAEYFLNLRVFSSLVIFIATFFIFKENYFLPPVITIAYYITLPMIAIDPKIKKRQALLEKDAMYFFEILTLSLESGRTLQNALEITSSNIESDLSVEFRYALKEVHFGKSLDDSLDNMKSRIPSDTINNILLNIKESNIFGNNIVETLYNQIDFLRDKRTMKIKERINKIPLKVSVISVIFFIPLIILLIIGPVIIEYILG